jgi:hypothetical protein
MDLSTGLLGYGGEVVCKVVHGGKSVIVDGMV